MDMWFTEEESTALLRDLFPNGLGGADVQTLLCPEGWRDSPLRFAFHPTPERQFEEALHWHENLLRMRQWARKGNSESVRSQPDPPPDRATFLAEARSRPDAQQESDEHELARLVGLCLWDVLSDNHDVILPDGTCKDLGSFRATAGIIADFFSEATRSETGDLDDSWRFDCMDYCEFYMGTWAIGGRTDLSPVYRMIFARLNALGLDWHYAFPRLQMIRLAKPEPEGPEWESYDPSAAFEKQKEEEENEREHAKLEADLEKAHQESLEAAKDRLPPQTVTAYYDVFGRWPSGWPPWEES